MRTSSFVHGLMTRRAVFAFTVLADFAPLTVLFKALGIIQVLHLNAAQIGMRCGDKKAGSLTYSILSENWYVIVLPASYGSCCGGNILAMADCEEPAHSGIGATDYTSRLVTVLDVDVLRELPTVTT